MGFIHVRWCRISSINSKMSSAALFFFGAAERIGSRIANLWALWPGIELAKSTSKFWRNTLAFYKVSNLSIWFDSNHRKNRQLATRNSGKAQIREYPLGFATFRSHRPRRATARRCFFESRTEPEGRGGRRSRAWRFQPKRCSIRVGVSKMDDL